MVFLSTSDELFEKYTNRFGGTYKLDNQHFRRIRFEFYEKMELFKIKHGKDSIPDIHLGFINNDQFQAMTFKYENKYFVGISIGTIHSLFNFFNYLYSQEYFLSESGELNLKKEDSLEIDKSKRKLIDYFYNPDIGIPNNTRLYESYQTFYKAIHYLIMHEVSHVLNGHLDFNTQTDGRFMMFEEDIIKPSKMDIRKALEYDADSAATTFCINPSYVFGMNKHNLKISLRELVIAMYFVFNLPALIDVKLEDFFNRTYPYPAQRVAIQITTIATLLIDIEKKTGIDSSEMVEFATNIYFECIKASAKMFGNHPIEDKSLFFYSKQSKIYADTITSAWNSIRDDLQEKAFIKIASKDEELDFNSSFDFDQIISKRSDKNVDDNNTV